MESVFFLFLFTFVVPHVHCDDNAKRLLLNDPALIMDRLAQLEKTVNEQATEIHTQASEIHSQAAEIRQLQARSNSTCDCTTDSAIAFLATLKHNFAFGSSGILRFDHVRTNAGNGYDPVTGVFIAPKDGFYHFTSVVYNAGGDDTEVQLNRNSELIVRGYSTATAHAASHSMNAVLSLKKGDHVYIQHRGSATDTVHGDEHASFSGFLISE